MEKFLKVLFPILTLLSMLYIFSNSLATGQEASGKRDGVVEVVEEVVEAVTGEEVTFTQANKNVFSKLFHVFEFCAFSFCLSTSIYLHRKGLRGAFQQILLCGVLTALADEQLQMLSPERGSRLSDVFVDLAGVLIGFFLCFCMMKIFHKGKKNGTDSAAF